MAFQEFLARISSPALRQIAEHWGQSRGLQSMPAWVDLRPSAIAGHLSVIWSWRYDLVADSFTGRLAGDAIEAVFGRTIRNVPMRDVFPPDRYETIFRRHKRVVSGPAFFHGSGFVFHHLQQMGSGERIIMPLSDCRTEPDGLLGATVYTVIDPLPDIRLISAQEHEEWFALD
jgi:hypothetical protein